MARWKVYLARIACVLILAGGFKPLYLQMFTGARTSWAAALVERPYQKMPVYRAFMNGVAERTPPDARIAIAVPAEDPGAYTYGFLRGTYLLAPRITVPLFSGGESPTLQNIRYAEYVAAWHVNPHSFGPHFERVWSDGDGTLLRRVR